MDLRDYLRVLRRGWHIVLAFVAIGLLAGIGITLATTKVYEATAQVFVATSGTSTDISQLAQGSDFTTTEVQSYTTLVNAPKIVTPVSDELLRAFEAKKFPGLTETKAQFAAAYSPSALASKITADAPLNKVLVNIHATDHSPAIATFIANHAASAFTTYVEHQIEQETVSGTPLVKANVVHPAEVPSAPVKPNKILNIALGFVLGLLLGIGAVILRDVLDNTVKGPEDFEPLGTPVLGMVPLDKRTQRQPIAFRADPHSSRAEAYRQLRTNLQFVNVDRQPRIIAVTSAIPGEGKTTTAMNLAAALADAGHRVVLVEADLRRPNIAKTLGLVGEVGFTSLLIGQATLEDALQNAGRNLAVLTSGPVPPNPSELLITEQAKNVIHTLADRADFVIVDTAPLLPVADGSEVAALADATVVVHRAGKTTRDQAARCAEALDKVGERAVGVVLNMISRSTGSYDYQYGYTYSYRPDRSHNRDEHPVDVGENGHVGAVNGVNGTSVVPGMAEPMPDDRSVGATRPAPTAPDQRS